MMDPEKLLISILVFTRDTTTVQYIDRVSENCSQAGVRRGRRGGEAGTGSVEVSVVGAGQIKAEEVGADTADSLDCRSCSLWYCTEIYSTILLVL
jgi:hypothetical protein